MNKLYSLQKEQFNSFIEKLASQGKVVAPVAREANQFSFQEVRKGEQVAVAYTPTILPPKKYYLPQCETIQTFNKEDHTWAPVVEAEPMTVFGVHTCDLAGIKYLDQVMESGVPDANYLARKEKISTIGLECNDYCDKYASCKAMRTHLPDGGYDICFTELKEVFLADVATKRGEEIVKKTGVFKSAEQKHTEELTALRKQKEEIFSDEVDVSHDELKPLFDRTLKSKVWEDLDRRCVSCGNCTNVCPTCYCFDIQDELNLDLKTGSRCRVWDSCQNEDFAKVAGNENFRKGRGHRQKHRYLRKFKYSVERQNTYACTGCGRCTRTCMSEISLKETINALAAEQKNANS